MPALGLVPWYNGSMITTGDPKLLVQRVQTGVRMEKRILKVLKGFAEYHDMSLGDLLEGIVLHSFDGKVPFTDESLRRIKELMAAGEVRHPAVARGVQYLIDTQSQKGLWDEQRYTATGFPRVFYLRYHGYPKFFPLWALARYRNLRNTNSRVVGVGM